MQGKAIVIQVKSLNETDAFLKLLADDGSVVRGFFKSGFSKKNAQSCQIGNLVDFSWVGRENSLGSVKIQTIKSYASLILSSKVTTLGVLSIIEIVNALIDENHNYFQFYLHLLDFLQKCVKNLDNTAEICFEYIKLEIAFLITTGYHTISEIKEKKYDNFNFLERIFSRYNKVFPSSRKIFENIIVKNLENNNFGVIE